MSDERTIVLPEKHRNVRKGHFRFIVDVYKPNGHRHSGPTLIDTKLKLAPYAQAVVDDLSQTWPPATEPKLPHGTVRVAWEQDPTRFVQQSW